MNADIVVPVAFFLTVIVLAIVVPIIRSTLRRSEREAKQTDLSPELALRLDRIESVVESVAVEVERLAEGQRFTSRLLSESAASPFLQQARAPIPERAKTSEVTDA